MPWSQNNTRHLSTNTRQVVRIWRSLRKMETMAETVTSVTQWSSRDRNRVDKLWKRIATSSRYLSRDFGISIFIFTGNVVSTKG